MRKVTVGMVGGWLAGVLFVGMLLSSLAGEKVLVLASPPAAAQVGGGATGSEGYALQIYGGVESTPTDGQTVFWGGMINAPNTTAVESKVYIPKAGNMVLFRLFVFVNGTLATTENVTYTVRLNNSTDTALAVTVTLDAATVTAVDTGSIAVVAGDFVEIKAVYPTWSTNPTNVLLGGVIFID